jgi:diaminohydroxyphosphoribosylaminopyrimidine deaminase/5-amino-6-(5-phosphoribosylamino)uracil reductase
VGQPLVENDAVPSALDADIAWSLLLQLASQARAGRPLARPTGFVRVERGEWQEVARPQALLWVDPEAGAIARGDITAAAKTMLDLYLPLLVGPRARRLTLGHLGQSLDGRVATPTGCSQFITGREGIEHTHRLRALFDAVLVGVRTVELDDPQLTTRLVPGEHPTRVVLDPQGKLKSGYKVLADGAAPTLVFTDRAGLPAEPCAGHVEWLELERTEGGFDVSHVLARLAERGLSRVFVEGGGVTVSRFLAARALDRLHVSVAPMILGSGAPAFALPPIDRLEEALTLRCRHFVMGPDILFDCELAARPVALAE